MSIYTRSGDDGKTALADGTRLEKSSLRVSVLGTVDELNSVLGIVRSSLAGLSYPTQVDLLLKEVQKVLFEVGSELARVKKQRLTPEYTRTLEEVIDYYQEKLPPLDRFILPGGSEPAAFLHFARTITRRAERLLVALSQKDPTLNPELIRFFNRLSDLLFVLARFLNRQTGGRESFWQDPPSNFF